MTRSVWFQNVAACSSRSRPWCSSCGLWSCSLRTVIWFSLSDRHSTDLSHRNSAQHPIYLYPSAIGRGLGQEVRSALRHAFSGCSSTSAFIFTWQGLTLQAYQEDESFKSSEALWQALETSVPTRGTVAGKTDLTALVHASECQGTAQTPRRLAQTSLTQTTIQMMNDVWILNS